MKNRDNRISSGVFAILFILVLLPLVAVLFQIVCPGLELEEFDLANLSILGDVFTRPLWRKAFLNSLALAAGTTCLGLIVAAILAWVRTQYQFPGAKLIDLAAWVLMIIPSFILAQGWVYFSAGNGIASAWLNIPWMSDFVFSFPGLVTVMTLCKWPMAYITIRTALEWEPIRLMHAARMNGASSFQVWKDVQLPLMLPALCSAAMLVFMDTVGDYGLSSTITAVYSFPTLPYTIYSAIRTSPARFDMAGVLSLCLMVLIVLAMFVQYKAIGSRKYDFLDNGTQQASPRKIGGLKKIIVTGFSWLYCLVALGVPIGSSLIMSFSSGISISKFSFTLDNYINVFAADSTLLTGIGHSLGLAVIAAVIGLVIAFCTAFVLTYSRSPLKKAIDMTTLIAMAVPGVVLGIGYIFVWNQKWLVPLGLHLYGTPAILVLAVVAAAIPLINRILVAGMAKIPESMMTAAEMQGAGFFTKIRTILLPLLHNSSVSAVLSAFGGSIFNLAITTILYPPNWETLPVWISDSYNDLKFGDAAAATIVSGICIITIMFVLQWLLNINQKKKGEVKLYGNNAEA